MAYLHEKKITWLDCKSSNVLIMSFSDKADTIQANIFDFDCSQTIGDKSPSVFYTTIAWTGFFPGNF
jgi:hypothetical protein